jgi:hypothetical protein
MTYTPRPGSVADYVLQQLRAPGAPARVSSYSIQRALGKPSAANIWMGCDRAVDYGLLVRESENGRTWYSLPAGVATEPGVRVMAWTARQAVTEIRAA